MAATINNTLVKIQTVTVGSGGASSIDFTSIPQTYTDLVIKLSGRSDRNVYYTSFAVMTFNGSTSSYSRKNLSGNGSTAYSQSGSGAPVYAGFVPQANTTSNTFGNTEIYIPNYASSNYKSFSTDSVMEINDASNNYLGFFAGLWSNTSAITSIKLEATDGGSTYYNWVQYTTATLYGVTATPNTTKASGGIIYQDATYMYHVFPYSGTFTPSTTLSADVLCIAGGGASGGNYGNSGSAGGGAGGLSYQSGRSLTATGYTVTIGGGGAPASASYGGNGSNSVFDTITSNGGGGGGGGNSGFTTTINGQNGGSGGGAMFYNSSPYTGTAGTSTQGNTGGATGYGYAGGTATSGSGNNTTGAGGGAGGVGGNGTQNVKGGDGGVGSSSYSSWAIATNTGSIIGGTGYYAGGGSGGGQGSVSGTGGNGGGGNKNTAGTINTGGGGGGLDGTQGGSGSGLAGGSGLVIIRYAK